MNEARPKVIRKIMAAICFSKYCAGTLELAAMIADKFDAKLVLVNVINVRDVEAVSTIESMGYSVQTKQYIEGVEEERISEFEKMVDRFHFPHDHVKIILRVGHPYEELMKVIHEEEVDMLVMGMKGKTDFDHIHVGSIADKLFRHSPVTVVSNREKKTV